MSEVIVVIGAGPGIGLAVARRFGREGMKVALLSRRGADMERAAAQLSEAGITARGYACDAERAHDVADALQAVVHDLGPVDCLVYNAAVPKPGGPLEVGLEQLVRQFRVDVGGALVAVQRVVPHMKAVRKGSILLTGGGLALDPWPQMTALAIGKAGLRSLALSLFKELKPHGIHAATVTVDGLVAKGGKLDPDAVANVYWELHQQKPEAFEAERVVRG
ncbi:MAG: SDR family NAD(P)-dependent oxidoreductase [Deltaproteobacteria bacterium]|nr:SDR family NAD(P)-dependent oxidoreductase [Deltaproteobacteria bacterium]